MGQGSAEGDATRPLAFAVTGSGEGAIRVVVQGEIDYNNASSVYRQMVFVVAAYRPRRVELDLSGVPFVDSSAIAALLVASRRTRASGAQFAVTDVQDDVRTMLNIAGLGPLLGMDLPPNSGSSRP